MARKMLVESLENRALMAGDVLASVRGSILRLEGDAAANEVAMTDLGGGRIEVKGVNGTTINGSASAILERVHLGIRVELKEGNDVLSFVGNKDHILPNVSISTGTGNDSLTIDALAAGLFRAETGLGNDRFQWIEGSAAAAKVELGGGDDLAILGSVGVRSNATIRSGGLKVEAGAGNDRIVIEDVVLKTLAAEFEGGDGDDNVLLRDVQADGLLRVEAGLGKDTAAVEDSTFVNLTIEMGAGDDVLSVLRSKSRRTNLQGGLGTDSLATTGSELGTLRRSGFETTV